MPGGGSEYRSTGYADLLGHSESLLVFSYSMTPELANNTVGFPDTYLVKRSSVSLQLSTNTKVTTASLDLERQTVVESQASRQITNACAWQVLSPADHNPDPSSHPRLEEASTPDSK